MTDQYAVRLEEKWPSYETRLLNTEQSICLSYKSIEKQQYIKKLSAVVG